MTVWLIKDNILQDDTTNTTIYKASLIKKFTATGASSKSFLRTMCCTWQQPKV